MLLSIRSLLACLTLLVGIQLGWTQDLRDPRQNPLPAIRADRWGEARAAAARFADPVTEKLVLYYRLLTPGGATAPEIADFVQRNPDWPQPALLERRRQEAIALEPDDATVLAQCAAGEPSQAPALMRCAEGLANAGRNKEAEAMARKAW